MRVTLPGIMTLVRLEQPSNAPSPMLVTLLGIVTVVTLIHKSGAPSPILVTGSLLMVSGMMTAPPRPVYPVMVIVPLLVTL